ncbi:MAG: hypothetical protein PHR53_02535 [Bacteroidales bacterium]|nr:hypothetical protein [Bacteroidales bacterium]
MKSYKLKKEVVDRFLNDRQLFKNLSARLVLPDSTLRDQLRANKADGPLLTISSLHVISELIQNDDTLFDQTEVLYQIVEQAS